jgi:hypothetical protein
VFAFFMGIFAYGLLLAGAAEEAAATAGPQQADTAEDAEGPAIAERNKRKPRRLPALDEAAHAGGSRPLLSTAFPFERPSLSLSAPQLARIVACSGLGATIARRAAAAGETRIPASIRVDADRRSSRPAAEGERIR